MPDLAADFEAGYALPLNLEIIVGDRRVNQAALMPERRAFGSRGSDDPARAFAGVIA